MENETTEMIPIALEVSNLITCILKSPGKEENGPQSLQDIHEKKEMWAPFPQHSVISLKLCLPQRKERSITGYSTLPNIEFTTDTHFIKVYPLKTA